MRRVVIGIAWLSAGVAVAAFVMPWAMIDVREPGLMKQLRESSPARDTFSGLTKDLGRITATVRRGTETITGTLPSLADIPRQVSGIQIPQMVNQHNAQVAVALIELFTRQRQDLGWKSYAVYLVPGIALFCGLLITVLTYRKPVVIGCALVCAAIAGVGFWKLLTTNTQALFIAITIGRGLWLSLWAYVGLAAAAVLATLVLRAQAE